MEKILVCAIHFGYDRAMYVPLYFRGMYEAEKKSCAGIPVLLKKEIGVLVDSVFC